MFNTTAYRNPSEYPILIATISLVICIIILTAAATLCGSALFIILALILSYHSAANHHQKLIMQADQVSRKNAPRFSHLIQECALRLQVEPINIFILPARELNAYTFGLSSPKAIVLYQPLFRVMDESELQFIIGHEMGHVRLGHTWLNSIVGGMAGIPASASATLLLVLALRWWNRACEYSADRAGLLACGDINSAIKALVKIEAGSSGYLNLFDENDLHLILQTIENQDDNPIPNMSEFFATHPMIISRLRNLRDYAQTAEYKNLQVKMNMNLTK